MKLLTTFIKRSYTFLKNLHTSFPVSALIKSVSELMYYFDVLIGISCLHI